MTRSAVPTGAAIAAVIVGAGALFATGGRRVPVAPEEPAASVAAERRTVAPERAVPTAGRAPEAAPVEPLRGIAGVPPPLPDRPLEQRPLLMPVRGVAADELSPGFELARGDRRHEALDIMAPTGTPVVAVDDGHVAKLFTSKAGGITIYQFDPERTHAYYYAHLDRYAPGLADGQEVERGQLLGYVGTTGNAPKDAPHLHFAIFRLTEEKRWWEGTAIDPYPLLRRADTWAP